MSSWDQNPPDAAISPGMNGVCWCSVKNVVKSEHLDYLPCQSFFVVIVNLYNHASAEFENQVRTSGLAEFAKQFDGEITALDIGFIAGLLIDRCSAYIGYGSWTARFVGKPDRGFSNPYCYHFDQLRPVAAIRRSAYSGMLLSTVSGSWESQLGQRT